MAEQAPEKTIEDEIGISKLSTAEADKLLSNNPDDEAEEAEETPDAEATEEAAEEPAEEDATEEDPEEATEEEATQEEEPEAEKPDPAVVAAAQAAIEQQTRHQTAEQQLAQFVAELEKQGVEYDPFTHGPKFMKLMMDYAKALKEQVQAAEQRAAKAEGISQVESFWQGWARENPTVGTRGRTMFDEELSKAVKTYGKGEAAHAVATEKWKARIELVKAKARTATPTASSARPVKTPPVTKGGAQLTPQSKHRVPKPAAKSIDDKLDAGDYGNLADVDRML